MRCIPYLIFLLVLPFHSLAEMVLSDEEFSVLMVFIRWVADQYALLTITIMFAIGYVWALLRQLISPKLFSKLPHFIIVPLEFLAANRGHARNEITKDPIKLKRNQN